MQTLAVRNVENTIKSYDNKIFLFNMNEEVLIVEFHASIISSQFNV